MIENHPEYRVENGEVFFEERRSVYRFSSHNFIEQYRASHQSDYARLLMSCRHSGRRLDKNAHSQIAACLGRYARNHPREIIAIGRSRSRDVHGNTVRPMWWIYYGRILPSV